MTSVPPRQGLAVGKLGLFGAERSRRPSGLLWQVAGVGRLGSFGAERSWWDSGDAIRRVAPRRGGEVAEQEAPPSRVSGSRTACCLWRNLHSLRFMLHCICCSMYKLVREPSRENFGRRQEVSGLSFGHHCLGPWTATGGSVKAEGLGDGATPGARVAPQAADKFPIAKLALDAATHMPESFHGHGRRVEQKWGSARCP